MFKKAWEVPIVNIGHALQKVSLPSGIVLNDLNYTVLDNEHVSYYGAQELAELQSINDKRPAREYVAFKPDRLAWHETIVAVSTTLQLADELEMHTTCMTVYEDIIEELEALKLDEVRKNIQEEITALVDKYLSGETITGTVQGEIIAKIGEEIKQNGITFGKYKPGYTIRDALITRVTDILYNEQANKCIAQLVAKKISENPALKALEIPKEKERVLLTVTGGRASGKGSSVARLQEMAEQKGIEWSNIVKINTDSYKNLLLQPGTQIAKKELYSQLATEEAAMIHQKILTRLMEMAKDGKMPHVFVDQVYVSDDKINYGLLNGGTVMGIVVSTDTADAVKRSYQRGESEGISGRYEDTVGTLLTHKRMAIEIPKTLSKYVGKNVYFLMVDNNVPKGEQPKDVMYIDLSKNTIEIYSQANLERFISKCQLNENATSEDNLYNKLKNEGTFSSYLKPLVGDDLCVITKKDLISKSPNDYEIAYAKEHSHDDKNLGIQL